MGRIIILLCGFLRRLFCKFVGVKVLQKFQLDQNETHFDRQQRLIAEKQAKEQREERELERKKLIEKAATKIANVLQSARRRLPSPRS